MATTVNVSKNVEVIAHYDTVVCGGGSAGWIAAISSARSGKKTALIERYGFLGGTATAGYVIPISGFHFKGQRVVGGIGWEFVKRLESLGAAQVELPKGHVSVHPEYYKLVAEQMVVEAGVELYTNSYISSVVCDGDRMTHVVFESKNGTEALSADCFIDATGDADLFHMAGATMLEGKMQPMSLCFVLAGVDLTTPLMKNCIHHDGKGGSASRNAVIGDFLMDLYNKGEAPQFCGPWFNALIVGDSIAVNITRAAADATDRESYSAAERKLRENMFEIVELLRGKYEEFKNCEIVSSAINAGIRETRHIKGVYTVTLEDFESGRTFDLPVAHSAHPMDIHLPDNSGQILIQLEKNCFVPYETMVSSELCNVIAAGRCISAEEGPYASLRVQATLMSIGEAAGLAASLSVDTKAPVYALPKDQLRAMIDTRAFVL